MPDAPTLSADALLEACLAGIAVVESGAQERQCDVRFMHRDTFYPDGTQEGGYIEWPARSPAPELHRRKNGQPRKESAHV